MTVIAKAKMHAEAILRFVYLHHPHPPLKDQLQWNRMTPRPPFPKLDELRRVARDIHEIERELRKLPLRPLPKLRTGALRSQRRLCALIDMHPAYLYR